MTGLTRRTMVGGLAAATTVQAVYADVRDMDAELTELWNRRAVLLGISEPTPEESRAIPDTVKRINAILAQEAPRTPVFVAVDCLMAIVDAVDGTDDSLSFWNYLHDAVLPRMTRVRSQLTGRLARDVGQLVDDPDTPINETSAWNGDGPCLPTQAPEPEDVNPLVAFQRELHVTASLLAKRYFPDATNFEYTVTPFVSGGWNTFFQAPEIEQITGATVVPQITIECRTPEFQKAAADWMGPIKFCDTKIERFGPHAGSLNHPIKPSTAGGGS